MSAISNTSYTLPPRRPWDPSRSAIDDDTLQLRPTRGNADEMWVEGKVVKGHPNICPLLDFFEDNHYYYLVLPSTTPEQRPNEPPPSSDLFDLVETFPQGLPSSSIRTYLGQIADALCFLHHEGIGERCCRTFSPPLLIFTVQFTVISRMKMLSLGLMGNASLLILAAQGSSRRMDGTHSVERKPYSFG